MSGGGPDVRVWDAKSGAQTGTLSGHQHYISSLDFDDERRLITGIHRLFIIINVPHYRQTPPFPPRHVPHYRSTPHFLLIYVIVYVPHRSTTDQHYISSLDFDDERRLITGTGVPRS